MTKFHERVATNEADVQALQPSVVAISGNLVLQDPSIKSVFATAASDITVTLPLAGASIGKEVTVKKVDSGSGKVIISAVGNIDGQVDQKLMMQNESVTFVSDGSDWHIGSAQWFNGSITSSLGTAFRCVGSSLTELTVSRNGDVVTVTGGLNLDYTGTAGQNAFIEIHAPLTDGDIAFGRGTINMFTTSSISNAWWGNMANATTRMVISFEPSSASQPTCDTTFSFTYRMR